MPVYKHRRPSPGRFGTHPVFFTFSCPATPVTANTTVTYYIAAPGRKMFFSTFGAVCNTVGADADGTILARVRKYNAATTAFVTMSADIDLEALTTKQTTTAAALSTATDANLFVNAADCIVVDVVNNSAAVDTQPTNLTFTIECFEVE